MPKKKKTLDDILKDINDDYGKGTIMPMDGTVDKDIDVIPSGVEAVDTAIGVGGFPKGRMVEVFGKEQSGKTTLALKLAGSAQAQGLKVAYIDAEHELNLDWATLLGVNVTEMLLSQPEYGEQALEIVEKLVDSKEIGLIIVDSVAALVPQKELEGDMGDSNIGLHARLMSQAMRKLKGKVKRSGVCIIFINQIRMKIGQWGNPMTTPGGLALKFYAAVRIYLSKMATLKKSAKPVGFRVKATVKKNKLAPPFQEGVYDIMFDTGIVPKTKEG